MIQNFLLDRAAFSCRKPPSENLVLHAGPSATPEPCLIPPNATPQCSEKCIPPAWSGSFNRSFQVTGSAAGAGAGCDAGACAGACANTAPALQTTNTIASRFLTAHILPLTRS